jgi:hypothetical protein
MPDYPEWRKRACPHCAAGCRLNDSIGSHLVIDADGYREWVKCQAPPAEDYIAILEARIAAGDFKTSTPYEHHRK